MVRPCRCMAAPANDTTAEHGKLAHFACRVVGPAGGRVAASVTIRTRTSVDVTASARRHVDVDAHAQQSVFTTEA